MNFTSTLNTVMKHVWTEPRAAAQINWHSEYGIGAQLMGQVPRDELEAYVDTGQHQNPGRVISIVIHEEPDWDWWEPTTRWRREAARERELDALMEAA